jgi:hypothetical protein
MLGEANRLSSRCGELSEALCRDLIESVQKENGTSIALKTDIESESHCSIADSKLGLSCERS